ncbi:MAG: 2'-5' RNA ligase family protein [Planctomycetes bacterium]|nr:2'-5' RNA ligase family protein [Planctomycetota bacterium]
MSSSPLLAITARPVLAESDRAWIESIRREHDPQSARIGLHVTLAFPARVELGFGLSELASAAQVSPRFECAFDRFEPVREPGTSGGHVFWLPELGRKEFEALHDRFYRGAFRAHLRAEPPYVPHVTVAAKTEFADCVELARELMAMRPRVRGHVEELELLDVGPDRIELLARVPLAPA